MVFYLGLNYLEQALSEKRNLLEKCLIVVPQHLDHVEAYIHKGKLPDDKYRFPWKRAKRDDEFLMQESVNIISDTQLLFDKNEAVLKVSSFFSQERTANTSLSEGVNFDLDCDVIPSSNPSTQDLFSPDDFFTEQNLFQESFEKENLHNFSSNCDQLKIESIESTEEDFAATLKNASGLLSVSSKLKTITVKDPFLLEDGTPLSEGTIFGNEKSFSEEEAISMLNNPCDDGIFKETFQKVSKPSRCKSRAELEDVIIADPGSLDSDSISFIKSELLSSVRGKYKTVILSENEPEVTSVVSKCVVKPEQIYLSSIENYDCSPITPVNKTFLDLNEIIVTEHDRKCEEAILDSPMVNGYFSDIRHSESQLPLPGREKLEIPSLNMCLLTNEKKEALTKRIWQNHRYCDEIQASRIPEPDLSSYVEERENAVKQSMIMLMVKPDTSTGTSDLNMNWEIIKCMEEIMDPCKLILPFSEDKITSDEPLEDVEPIEKFSNRDLYDWKDEEISVKDSEIKKTAVEGEKDRCKKPKVINRDINQEPLAFQTLSDPLGDFMALRSKRTSKKPDYLDRTLVCATKLQEPGKNIVGDKNQVPEDVLKLKQNSDSKKRVKHHVVEIRISEEYQHILDKLESASENSLNVLKQAAEISQNSSFKTITPDISRYLLKQKEKSLADQNQEGFTDELYKMTIILHGLVLASEITVHCCLESAIGCLSALQEKYKNVIGSALDSTRQTLFELKAQFYEKKIYHPKVVTLCREIETWLKKKRAKTKDSEQKILVLVQRDIPSLLHCVNKALSISNLLNPCILSLAESEHIIDSLDKHNCVIAPTKMVCENFPWAQFSLVVEYENDPSSQWQQLCERQHIRHIGLCIKSYKRKETTSLTSEYPEEQICLIGSQKIVQNIELLQLLETRHNILLIERDYSSLKAMNLFFSDIDIDASTAVVIEDMNDLTDDCAVQNLVLKMVALSLKYVNCWLILFANTKAGSYQYPGHVINNIGRLQAAIANFVEKSNHFKAKIMFCEGCIEMSSIIRSISEHCMILSMSKEQWLNRTWLKDEILQDERVLLMLPCLSSFSAQLLLNKYLLGRIFKSSAVDIQRDIPEIPISILQTLKELLRSNTGLHLQIDISQDQLYDDCDNVASPSKNVADDVENSESQIEETFIINTNENDEMCAEMYVPEDFQRKEVTKRYNNYMHLHPSIDNSQTLLDKNQFNSMLLTENKQLNDTDKNNKSYIDSQSKSSAQYIIRSKGQSEAENNYYPDVKTENVDNIEENIHRKRSEAIDWDHLNNFISSKTNANIHTSRKDYNIEKLDNRNKNEISMQNLRFLNPVEKLIAMKERNMLKKSDSDERESCFNRSIHNENNPESQYFVGETRYMNNGRQYAHIRENPDQSATHYLRNHNDNNEYIPLDYKRKSQSDAEDEMLADKMKSRKIEVQEIEPNSYTGCVSYHFKPKESLSDNSTETFDYNHGLPFKNDSLAGTGLTSTSVYPQLGFAQSSMNDLEKEFPPVEEIDRSIVIEKMPDRQSDSALMEKSSADLNKYALHENFPVAERSHKVPDMIQLDYHHLPKSVDYRFKQNESRDMQNDDSRKSHIDSCNSQFDFRPKLVDCSTDRSYSNSSHHSGKALVLNPNLARITRKPQCLEEHNVNTYSSHTQSLADDLRETTRKLLANSRQFSRFDTCEKRHPLQKVSIGLATPRVRNYKKATEDMKMTENEHRMMEQSLWATDDSPPMDLDYENSEIKSVLQNGSETSNRVIYTNLTPGKRRKLTYQFVPGKCQTKLVFK